MNTLAQPTTHGIAFPSTVTPGIVAYLLIAFGLAWGAWIPLWLLGVSPSSEVFTGGVMIGLFAPALGTIVVRQWITREGFADAGLHPHLRSGWPYYLFAWLWPLLAYTALTLAVMLGHSIRKDVSGDIVPALLSTLAMTPVLFGEEFGWRSYLQIRLFRDRPLMAAQITGAIWGVWHYPIVLAGYLPNQHGAGSLLLFPAYTILFSILLGWLRVRTGSVWAPCLAHAANNMILEALGAALFATTPSNGDLFLDPRGLIVVIPMLVLSTWIVISGQLKPDTPAPMSGASSAARRIDAVREFKPHAD